MSSSGCSRSARWCGWPRTCCGWRHRGGGGAGRGWNDGRKLVDWACQRLGVASGSGHGRTCKATGDHRRTCKATGDHGGRQGCEGRAAWGWEWRDSSGVQLVSSESGDQVWAATIDNSETSTLCSGGKAVKALTKKQRAQSRLWWWQCGSVTRQRGQISEQAKGHVKAVVVAVWIGDKTTWTDQ
jgi:hypothetical protein